MELFHCLIELYTEKFTSRGGLLIKIIMVTGKALKILGKGILIVNQVARISGIENGGNGVG